MNERSQRDQGNGTSSSGDRRRVLAVARQIEELGLRLFTEIGRCREEAERLSSQVAGDRDQEREQLQRSRVGDLLDQVPPPLRDSLREAMLDALRVAYATATTRERSRAIGECEKLLGGFLDQLHEASVDLGTLVRDMAVRGGSAGGSADGSAGGSAGGSPEEQGPDEMDIELERSILMAQEDEKKRVSIVIHDGPAQILANLIMRVDFCERLVTRTPADATSELKSLRQEMQVLLDGVRRLIFELRPMTLDDLGLVPTVQRFVENIRTVVFFRPSLVVRDAVEPMDKLGQIVLYRVLQEAISNVERHAEASRVTIVLRGMEGEVSLSVEDDGRGFDSAQLNELLTMGRLGLHTARKRVGLMGGQFQVTSSPGAGTTVVARIPREGRSIKS